MLRLVMVVLAVCLMAQANATSLRALRNGIARMESDEPQVLAPADLPTTEEAGPDLEQVQKEEPVKEVKPHTKFPDSDRTFLKSVYDKVVAKGTDWAAELAKLTPYKTKSKAAGVDMYGYLMYHAIPADTSVTADAWWKAAGTTFVDNTAGTKVKCYFQIASKKKKEAHNLVAFGSYFKTQGVSAKEYSPYDFFWCVPSTGGSRKESFPRYSINARQADRAAVFSCIVKDIFAAGLGKGKMTSPQGVNMKTANPQMSLSDNIIVYPMQKDGVLDKIKACVKGKHGPEAPAFMQKVAEGIFTGVEPKGYPKRYSFGSLRAACLEAATEKYEALPPKDQTADMWMDLVAGAFEEKQLSVAEPWKKV